MKFKKFSSLKASQKIPCSKAFYNYFKKVGKFNLPDFDSLSRAARTNYINRPNPSLHAVLVKNLSSYDIPEFKEIKTQVKSNIKKYYELLVDSVTGEGEVFKISGVISDEESEPIEGATLELDGEIKITDEEGKYEFTQIFNGVYTLNVSAEGFESKSSQVTVNSSNVTRNLTLTEEE